MANLFVHAARNFHAEAEGESRARSASEAFLYRRLQTLPELKDRFRLNAELPISFDNAGHMEVDFLCEELGLVLELDGEQHLTDAEAYRRDRRKDALLQQNGFFVLRFLAEDVAKRLELVLDTILASLVSRKNSRRLVCTSTSTNKFRYVVQRTGRARHSVRAGGTGVPAPARTE